MFHLVSLSLQIYLAGLPGPCLGLCVGVACFWLVLFLVGFFLPGKFDFNLMLMLLTDHVSHLSGNAGKNIIKIKSSQPGRACSEEPVGQES